MPEPIEFLLRLLVAVRLPGLRENRRTRREPRAQVSWRPILLGVVFKHTGAAPLTLVPLKGEYSVHDFSRSARFLSVPYTPSDEFSARHAARGARLLLAARSGLRNGAGLCALAFSRALRRGRDISDLDVVLELAARHGADRDLCLQRSTAPNSSSG
jgi:2-hydroxychromene-2-carboxylate isomerase